MSRIIDEDDHREEVSQAWWYGFIVGVILSLVIMVLMASVTPAHAAIAPRAQERTVGVPPLVPPPARYNKPFKGQLYQLELGWWELIRQCGWTVGCAPIGGDRLGTYPGITRRSCTILVARVGTYMPGFGRVDTQGQRNVIRHEIGHCNGWPANHPR
jgi:hypothetical protein